MRKTQEELAAIERRARSPVEVHAWACAICGGFLTQSDFQAAEHCRPVRCAHGLHERSGYCRDCARERQAARDAKAFEAATKVPLTDYEGEYFSFPGSDRLTHEDELEDMREELGEDGNEFPAWAFGCKPRTPSVCLDNEAEHIADVYLDEESGRGVESLPGWSDLGAAVGAFNARQKPTLWVEDRSVVVLLPPAPARGDE